MKILEEQFGERLSEIESYIDFLDTLDAAIKAGQAGTAEGATLNVTVTQQRMLYSSVYLQLYNLVEATITNCLQAVSKTALETENWMPSDLTDELRKEWVKYAAKTNAEMGPDKRLLLAIALCDHMVAALPVPGFDIEKGGGGNWDEDQIRKIVERLGFKLTVSRGAYQGIKKIVRNEMGAMALIVNLRNRLAHGSLSFVECGQDDTPGELRILVGRISAYMREVVKAFVSFLDNHGYVRPEKRPAALPA